MFLLDIDWIFIILFFIAGIWVVYWLMTSDILFK